MDTIDRPANAHPLDVLHRALEQDPENTLVEIEALDFEYYESRDEGREAEIETRFRELADHDLPIGQLAYLSDAIPDEGDSEKCRQRLRQRVLDEGLHLVASEARPPEATSLSGGDWQRHLLTIRRAVVEESIAGEDRATLRQVLTEGSGFGYGALWQHALELAESEDPSENGAPSSLAGEICGWLEDVLPLRPQDHLLHLRLAHRAITGPEVDLELAEKLVESVLTADIATVRERAEAHYLRGRLAVLAGHLEEATPHLAHFYDLHLEHAVCPAGILGCDRDYPLHLIATGNWPRLEAYQSRKAVRAAERRAAAKPRFGDKLHAFNPVILEKMRAELIHEDPVLAEHFLEPACGLPTALPHLQALLTRHPEDPDLQDRHAREQARTCHREGPRPSSRQTQPLAADLEAREAALLLSARHP